MRFVLLGKPGSGKGTQARRLAADRGAVAIATGDLIRRATASGSALGAEFARYADAGKLVPDDLMLALVEDRLAQPDCRGSFLLDGFPRTIPQAEALERLLAARQQPLELALNIRVPDAALIERAGGRRFCANDGASFHVEFAPPKRPGICDHCGQPLGQRPDDQPEVVRRRVTIYNEKTAPLIDFYRARGILKEVDGQGTPAEVGARIEAALAHAVD